MFVVLLLKILLFDGLKYVSFPILGRSQGCRVRLGWTVDAMDFSGLKGEVNEETAPAGVTGWEVRRRFKGTLHFDCTIHLR